MSNSSDNSSSYPRTEVWQGEQEIFKKGLEELYSVKTRYDSIVDDNGPSIILNNDVVLQAYSDIINRGCRIRLITEISAKNISYCKKLSKLSDLRHFGGVKGNLGIVDGLRYGASAKSEEKNFQQNTYIALLNHLLNSNNTFLICFGINLYLQILK